MRKYILILINILSSLAFSADLYPNTEVMYKAHEITITDSKIARKIFIALPGHSYSASMVNELLIKNHRYFYCVREPAGQFLCHLYLNFKYTGEFSNFEKDHNYGVGSLLEYRSKEVIKGASDVEVSETYLTLKMEGQLARKLYSKLDLAKVTYKRINETDVELRSGRHIRCANIYTPKSNVTDNYVCKVMIPLDPKKSFKLDDISLGLN